MKRIDTINVRKNLFGTGKHGFHDNADLPGQDATYLSPDWLNMLQEELCNVLELEKVALNPSSRRQLHDFLFNKFITKSEVGSNPNQIPSMGNFGLLDRGYGYISRSIPSNSDLASQSYVTGWYSLAGIYDNAPVTTTITGQMLVSVRHYGAGAALVFLVWNGVGADFWVGACPYSNNEDKSVTPSGAINWKRVAYTDSNVASATKLETERKINGVGFDGTKDITLPAATTSQGGTVQLNNTLTSTSTTQALTAAQGKILGDSLDILNYCPIPYPKSIPPNGYLVMMGQSISQSTYPKLFALYGNKLPDMRAYTIRGLDNGRGIDADRKILSEQEDAIRNITGRVTAISETFSSSGEGKGAFLKASTTPSGNNTPQGGDWSNAGTLDFDASLVVPTASENRVKNIAFLYIVKAG